MGARADPVAPARAGLRHDRTNQREETSVMDMKLEVVVIPVADVDRAKAFYQGLGWRLDADFATGPAFRVVQVTPPGSACSVIFGTDVTTATPGSAQGLQLITGDIERGPGRTGRPRRPGERRVPRRGRGFPPRRDRPTGSTARPRSHKSYGSWVSFDDPDGNSWFVQEVTTRLPGRATSALAAFDSAAGLADALRRAEAAHGQARAGDRPAPTRTGRTGTPSTWWPKQTARTATDGRLRLRRHRAGGRVAG